MARNSKYSWYTEMLARLLHIEPEKARLVEAYLRLQYKTLDALSATDFLREYYKGGIMLAIKDDPEGSEALAQSYGL